MLLSYEVNASFLQGNRGKIIKFTFIARAFETFGDEIFGHFSTFRLLYHGMPVIMDAFSE